MIVNQPFEDALGFSLIEKLQTNNYSTFRFIVAYAKTSGVNRLLPYMHQFKAAGGSILGIVGIDQNNTSFEALTSLHGICDALYVYHSEDQMRTFHVKAYHFSGINDSWLAIGSNNFTAGGLFSNYEASISCEADGFIEEEFLRMFGVYSNTASPCCKLANNSLIDVLLERHYIQREQVLARQRIAEATRQRLRQPGITIFGRDAVVALPRIPVAPERAVPHTSAEITPVEEPFVSDMSYLIRHVPRAGGRSMQVHFTMDILRNYFNLTPGDLLNLQQIDDIYTPHPIENRRVVYSQRNRNVKIEVAAASILNDNYPEDESKRPILVFKRVNPSLFEYMLLQDGDEGYDELNERLLGLHWRHRSLPYEVVDADTMLTIWENCPMI